MPTKQSSQRANARGTQSTFDKQMINLSTCEISFLDGLLFTRHCRPPEARYAMKSDLPAIGWTRYNYGSRISEYGIMDVGAVCNDDSSIHMVIMSHEDPRYHQSTPGDHERKEHHEYIVSKDLLGQREFSWDIIHVSTDSQNNKN